MNIVTELSANTGSNVRLDKFFQFIVVSNITPAEDGFESNAKIGVYTCLISSCCDTHVTADLTDANSPVLNCVITVNGVETDEIEDRSHFFLEESNIRGFWGERSVVKSPSKQDIEALLGVGEIPSEILRQSKIVYIDQSHMKSCVLVKQFKDNQSLTIGKDKFPNGYWLYHEFNTCIDSNSTGVGVKAKVKLDKINASSPDLRVYFQFPKSLEIHNERVEITPSEVLKTASDQKSSKVVNKLRNFLSQKDSEEQNSSSNNSFFGAKARVERVFSQSRIEYYDEWIQGGIKKSNLFRLQENKQAQKLMDDGLEELSIDMALIDVNKPKEREYKMLLYSLLLSLFCSYGLDATRQNLIGFQNLFLLGSDFITFMWLLLCVGIGIKLFFYFKVDKILNYNRKNKDSFFNKMLVKKHSLGVTIFPELLLTVPYLVLGESISRYLFETLKFDVHAEPIQCAYQVFIYCVWFFILISVVWFLIKTFYIYKKGD
ncbi:hypothetical protein ACHSBP_19500 [Pseudoalteromonas sp. XMcav1-K]|uniref:hypothetical protein n=1 Tax=Pseudoalteromonas sp. XMcav1-K TaxID=3374372 RepID=UPI003757376B